MAATKIKEKALEDVALLAGTQQNLRNLYFLDIYDKSGNLDLYGTKPEAVFLVMFDPSVNELWAT